MTLTHHQAGAGRRPHLNPYIENRPWGRIELPDPIMVARTGIAHYRLSVFAPGTSEVQRRELQVARRWWTGSAAGTIAGELVVASAGLGSDTAIALAITGAAIFSYWLARTRAIRRGTRTLHVAIVMAVNPHQVVGDAELLDECRRELDRVDGEQVPTSLTAVEREAIWYAVYDRLAPQRTATR